MFPQDDRRIEYKRRQRVLAEQEREKTMHLSLEQKVTRQMQKKREREEMESTIRAAAEARDKRHANEMKRKRIVKDSDEIRELERALQIAYASYEQKGQINTRHEERIKEREAYVEEGKIMHQKVAEEEAAIREREYNERIAMLGHGSILRGQIDQREKDSVESAANQLAHDKAMVNAIIAQIDAEEAEKAKHIDEVKKATIAHIKHYLEQKAIVAHDQKLRDSEEEERNERYRLAQEERERQRAEARKIVIQSNEALGERLAEALLKRQRDIETLEKLRLDLAAALQEEKELQKVREQEYERLRVRDELIEAARQSKRVREERERAIRAEEEAYKEAMLERHAKELEKERLSERKKKLAFHAYGRELSAAIAQRREERKAEHASMLEEERALLSTGDERKKIIEEERKRLIKEHAARLIGFLPPGILQSKEDLELLPLEVRAEVKRQSDVRELILLGYDKDTAEKMVAEGSGAKDAERASKVRVRTESGLKIKSRTSHGFW
eukprot:gnl/Carplike_NY0171/3202_a4306_447.p1 GENE.gnl/Carplike_NY0171/3202_a4306_447~~gnl/Carplike_NY0171/3202_a4306_447.p1  ORF type:complete len:510 (+),score=192.11 gnl/Carplike_NY0171/3202_a4306_447:25-1530(+)